MSGEFLEERLDPLITFGCKVTQRWKRNKIFTADGSLKQRFEWAFCKHLVDLNYRSRPKADYDELLNFFAIIFANEMIGFRVKIWSDYQLTQLNSAFVETLNGWQVMRRRAKFGIEYLHPVKKPVLDSIALWRTRGGVVSDADTVLDYTTGIGTEPAGHADGDTYTCVGEFDYAMFFSDEEWISNLEVNVDNLWMSPDPIMLEELPPNSFDVIV